MPLQIKFMSVDEEADGGIVGEPCLSLSNSPDMSLLSTVDPFADILTATHIHRSRHGCGAYPYDKGSMLGVLAAAIDARRIVEVGTALGYTSLWLSYGAQHAHIDTIEFDSDHVRIARQHFIGHKVADRIHVHHGEAVTVLDGLDNNAYDLAFFDGFEPTRQLVNGLDRRLRIGGILVCANLTLGRTDPVLIDSAAWLVHSFGETAIAVKR